MKETNKACSDCSAFCVQKRKESIVLTDPHKNRTKRRFLKTVLKVDVHQIGRSFKVHWNKVNAQTWRFLNMLQYATKSLTKNAQCERTKEDKFRSVFEIR